MVPLHNACSYGHFEITEMLIKHGANVNAMDLWQFTPLHEAASKSRIEVCSLLLSEGADPTLLNCHSKSAIDVAPIRELQEKLLCKFHFFSSFLINFSRLIKKLVLSGVQRTLSPGCL